MVHARVNESLRSFCLPYLALTKEGETLDGRFTITQGRSRKSAHKAIAPVSWTDSDGPRDPDDALRELVAKLDLVLDDGEPGHVWVSAHYAGQTKPEAWHRIEGDPIRSVDPLGEYGDVHGPDRAFLAMTSVIGMLMQGLGEANAQTLHNTRELGRVQAELMRAELVVSLMEQSDQGMQLQAALEALGPHLAPVIARVADNLTRPAEAAPAPSMTGEDGAPLEGSELAQAKLHRVRSDLVDLGRMAQSDPEAFDAETRSLVSEVLAMVDAWRAAAPD